MAAPSVSGLTTLRTLEFNTDSTNMSVEVIAGGGTPSLGDFRTGGYFEINGGATGGNVTYRVYIGFNETGTLDFTDKELLVVGNYALNIATSTNTFGIGLRDTSDRDRIYYISQDQALFKNIPNISNLLSFNDGVASPVSDLDFDITNVKGLVFDIVFGTVSNWNTGVQTGFTLNQIGYFDSTSGITLTGGEPGDLAATNDFIGYYQSLGITDDARWGLYKDILLEYLLLPTSATIGNASLNNIGGAIVFRALQTTIDNSSLTYPLRTLTINTTSTQAIDFQVKSAVPYVFRDIGVANNYRDTVIAGYLSANLGVSNYARVAFSGTGACLGGASFDGCSFSESTAEIVYNWNGTATFDNSAFSGTQDYYFRIGSDNVSNNATIDVSGITFGTPGITHFLIDGVTGIEIATAAGASLTKTEINSGSATFVTPVVSYARGVSGAPVGSAIAIFKRISSLKADRSQFTLAVGNDLGDGTLVIAETIPNDTPASGFIRVLKDDGIEDRLAFSSWSGSTFTLTGTLPATYSSGNGCYVGYIDVLGSSTGNESVNLEYVTNRNCVLVVRLGSGSGRIREIRQDITLANQDQVVPVSGFIDTINTTT